LKTGIVAVEDQVHAEGDYKYQDRNNYRIKLNRFMLLPVNEQDRHR
jgi:hypothetical protein